MLKSYEMTMMWPGAKIIRYSPHQLKDIRISADSRELLEVVGIPEYGLTRYRFFTDFVPVSSLPCPDLGLERSVELNGLFAFGGSDYNLICVGPSTEAVWKISNQSTSLTLDEGAFFFNSSIYNLFASMYYHDLVARNISDDMPSEMTACIINGFEEALRTIDPVCISSNQYLWSQWLDDLKSVHLPDYIPHFGLNSP